jgi:phosphatidylserine/phosphatidylglycerophosphate/cardiolipin synthase-like enzyme
MQLILKKGMCMKKLVAIAWILFAPYMLHAVTHVIVDPAGKVVSLPAAIIPEDGSIKRTSSNQIHVHFSPDDNVRQHLLKAIEGEQSSIKIAVFTLTDMQIAHELLRAHERGILVEIITDPTCLKDRFNKVTMLSQHGIPIYVYSTAHGSGLHSCMHHKFAIFEKNTGGQRYVWTGSFNFTKSASESNQENVVVIYQDSTVQRFEEQFKKLKSRSQRLMGVNQPLLRNKQK